MFGVELLAMSVPAGEEGSKRKKKVSWAEDSNLVMVHYFEMDESERGECELILGIPH